jgi:hypothetical protein
LQRGVPSIFNDVKRLYSNDDKRRIIEQLVEKWRQQLETTGKLDEEEGDDGQCSLRLLLFACFFAHTILALPVANPPTTLMWTLYFLAQHYSYLNRQPRALELIEASLVHTPSLPDLFMTKSRILKRGGDAVGAEEAMRSARELDGQDRFLNAKHAKYLLRVNNVEEAEAVVGLFTRVRFLARSVSWEYSRHAFRPLTERRD